MKKNSLIVTERDPLISIRVPSHVLRDLALRAEENGHSMELEFAIRLSRTLERDLEMIAEDNDMVLIAFERTQKQ